MSFTNNTVVDDPNSLRITNYSLFELSIKLSDDKIENFKSFETKTIKNTEISVSKCEIWNSKEEAKVPGTVDLFEKTDSKSCILDPSSSDDQKSTIYFQNIDGNHLIIYNKFWICNMLEVPLYIFEKKNNNSPIELKPGLNYPIPLDERVSSLFLKNEEVISNKLF